MCECVYVCMYVCMYVCTYVRMYVRTSHFSARTWQLRQRRVWLRKQLVKLHSRCQSFALGPAWICWVARVRLPVARISYVLRHAGDYRDMAAYVCEIRDTRQALRKSIRHDIGRRISDAASSAHHSSTGDVVSRLQSLIGPSKRKTKSKRGLPGLTLQDGSRATTPSAVEEAWVGHFSDIEAGVRRSAAELALSCVNAQYDKDLGDLDLTYADLPALGELETAFRQTMLHRAFGTDCIPAEALHSVPGAAARAFYSVVLKCAFRVQEPLHFKGGSLYAVWKGKASPGLCSSYRGILVSSTVGKAYHRILRSRNVGAFARSASPLQVGGLPKRPVTLAAHVVRLHQQTCCAEKASCGLLFLDLREAFYRIVRPLVTGFTGTDEEVANILAAVRLPAGVMHELRDHLQEQSLFRAAGATAWTAAATCEALSHTWFRFEHGRLVTETGIGTRPGDNLADIIFGFVFAQVLRQVRERVQSACGMIHLPWHDSMLNNVLPCAAAPDRSLPLLDCTWMDDSALVLHSDSAESLVGKLRHTTGALLDGCLGRALLPNLDRGKTEAVISLRGRHSRRLRKELFAVDPPTITVDGQLWPSAQIQLVSSYRHLGGIVHHDGGLRKELRHRTALAWAAFNKRRKHIFASPTVTWPDKATLFESLVLSVLLYGAGTWGQLASGEHRGLENTYHHMVHSMLRPRYSVEEARRLGAERALALIRLPTLDTLLHMARLRHLASCVTVASPEFWALAHREGSWSTLARASLTWLGELTDRRFREEDLSLRWQEWITMISHSPGSWKRLLRTSQQRALRREAWTAAHRTDNGLLARQLQAMGGLLAFSPLPAWECHFFCGPCNRTFSTKQKWSVHAFKTHGRKTAGRRVLPGQQCQCCLRHFATNLKLC